MNSTANINWEQLSIVLGDDDSPPDEEMKDLFRLFVDDAGRRLRTLSAPGASADRAAVGRESHKIRGAASSFGFDHVAGILRTVETEVNELAQAKIDDLLREALSIFEQSIREVHDKYPSLAG